MIPRQMELYREEEKLTDENEAKLREALDEFKKRYKAQSETEEKSETVEG